MKHFASILLLLCLLISMAACGDTTPAETTTAPAAAPEAATDGYVFSFKGQQIYMSADAQPILDALGEPVSTTEQTSCAFDGLDKTFYYGSFYMDTYPVDGKDYVYSLWLVDDTVTTAEGLYIGATQAQVESIYGAEGFNGSNAYIMTKGGSRLTIILEEGLVSSIQYDAVI